MQLITTVALAPLLIFIGICFAARGGAGSGAHCQKRAEH